MIKNSIFKKFVVLIVLAFLAAPLSAHANDSAEPARKKQTKTRIFNDPAPKEEKPEEKSEDAEAKKKTTEEEIWEKYKKLAAGLDNKPADSAPEKSGKKAEEKKELSEEKSDGGLSGILKEYQNRERNKGQMNSRSFGDLDKEIKRQGQEEKTQE